MVKHHLFKIDWIGFPKTTRRVKGVYMIGDFYVGKSNHIRRRILSHLHSAKRGDNDYKNDKISEWYYNYGCLKVTLLSSNTLNEIFYIKKYSDQLINKIK